MEGACIRVGGGGELGYGDPHGEEYEVSPSQMCEGLLLLANNWTKCFIYLNSQMYLGIEAISLPIEELRERRIRGVNPFAKNHTTPLTSANATGKAGPG